MLKRGTGFVYLFAALLVLSCSDSTNSGDKKSGDGVASDTEDQELYVPPTPDVPDVDKPDPPPKPGAFGYPCDDNSECDSEWCIATAEGNVCTQACVDECPAGWICAQVSLTGQDLTFACVPRFALLCNPCASNEDCIQFASQAGTESGNICIDHGPLGKFCGAGCDDDVECPEGYSCEDVPLAGGTTVRQCYPTSGECTCSKLATNLGKSTSCFVKNDQGKCYGYRECLPSGLSDCSAQTPSQEICNAVDDNCDNKIDNITVPEACDMTNEFGTCIGVLECTAGAGTGKCIAETPQKEVCDGLDQNCDGIADDGFTDTDGDLLMDCIDEDDDNDGINDEPDNCPLNANPGQEDHDGDGMGDECDPDDDNDDYPDDTDCEPKDKTVNPGTLEVCDKKDNDCDKEIDEGLCDDGNSCTDDKCLSDGNCVNEPNKVLCDDQDVCTEIDVCKEGKCVGKKPKNCDDGNMCTDDSCDDVIGCENNPNKADCEDGNPCTTDKCSGGKCQKTGFTDCNDNNPCTTDSCSTISGCVHSVGPNGVLCTTGAAQCGQGICNSGVCVPSDNVLCNTGSGKCPTGICSGGKCFVKPGEICEAKVKVDICNSQKVAGVCTGDGKCVVTKAPPSLQCPGCNGICIKCFILQFCVPFSSIF